MNGSADYDLDLIRDVLFVPNGVDSAYLEENYVLTGYINDVNTQYTQTLVEYGVSGAYDSVYEYGVQRTTMYQNGQVYSYEYDGRGSVSELVNSLGKTQIKYSYGAYGGTVSTVIGWNNPVTNPYRYNAERIDDVAGVPAFQYLRARYLNPYTSSFLSQDSYLGSLLIPLSQNRYTYVHNNPIMYIDPSGHWFGSALAGAIVGAVVGAVSATVSSVVSYAADVIEAKATGKDPSEVKFDWRGLGQGVVTGIASGAVSGAVLAGTGSTTLAGAAGGAVSGAMNGVFQEVNRAADTGTPVNWGDALSNAGRGFVTGGVTGAAAGLTGGVTGNLAGGKLLGAMVGGTSASMVGGIVGRAIDGDPKTSPFSLKEMGKDLVTGSLSSLAGYGIYSSASRIEAGGFGKALQAGMQKAQNGPEAKLSGLIADAWNAIKANNCTLATDTIDQTTTLYRGERSSAVPENVFENGFTPKGTHNDPLLHTKGNTTPGNFVSSSSDIAIATEFAEKNGYVYVIETDNYVDINSTYGSQAYYPEQFEFSIPGGVAPSEIVGVYPLNNGQITGEFISNPNYGGN